MIAQDMEQGLGLCLLDPHGDLTKSVISRVPDNRLGDVILLNLLDSAYPFGLNLFQCRDGSDVNEVATTAGMVMHVFEKVWGVGTETPLLAQVLRNITFTLIQNPGMTFNEIPLLLQDETARGKLTRNLTNNQVRLFWQTFNRLRPADQLERTSSTLNKVDAFLTQPIIANIVGQPRTTIDFRKIMDEGKILLVQLATELEDISSLIGCVIVGQILSAALSRKDIPEEKRRQFNLYADEYQRFATSDFATLLSEARKFGIATSIAHQTRSQLDELNKGASTNVANMIVFRISGEDALELVPNLKAERERVITGERPIYAPVRDVVKHLFDKGHQNPAVARFVNNYLVEVQRWKELAGESKCIETTHESGLWQASKNRFATKDIKQVFDLLNELLFSCMRDRTAQKPIPPKLLFSLNVINACQLGLKNFDCKYEYGEAYGGSGFSSSQPFDLLCSPMYMRYLPNLRAFAGQSRGQETKEYFERCVNLVASLREVMEILATTPIMVDTGQHEPIYSERPIADVRNEIVNTLVHLNDYRAKVKTLAGEYDIQTMPPTPSLTGALFEARKLNVLEQTRTAYCSPRSKVEAEIAARQDLLMQEEERIQGRREEVGQVQPVSQAQPFRPSRRHREPTET